MCVKKMEKNVAKVDLLEKSQNNKKIIKSNKVEIKVQMTG